MRPLVTLGLLAWLGGQPGDLAQVQWREATPELAEWLQENPDWLEGPCPLSLSVNGVHAFDDRELLLFGDVYSAPGAYRSFLLRSADGAVSWSEVMPPLLASSVLDVSFTSTSSGRALVGWVVEGPGPLWAYGTEDGGRTWQGRGEVRKPHSLDTPWRLTCTDADRCQIALECDQEPDGIVHLLETRDGGRRWRVRKMTAAAAPSFREPEARAPDGTSWRVMESADGRTLQVARRLARDPEWTPRPALPRDFTRAADGRLVPCAR